MNAANVETILPSGLRCILVVAGVLAGLSTTASGQSIRMLRVGVVTDDVIRVADVAELAGLDTQTAKAIGTLHVLHAPPPGATLSVKLNRLRDVLREARVNLAAVSLRGVTRCQVSRPAEMPKPKAVRRANRAKRTSSMRTASRPTGREARDGATLASAVRRFLRERLAGQGGTLNITFAEAVREALGLSAPQFNFRIRLTRRRRLGLVSLEVEVREGSRPVRKIPVMAEVTLTKRVVVAKSAINRGAPIRPEQLALAERTFTKLEQVGDGDPAAFAGNEATKFIPSGQVLHAGDVKALDLVKRGDRVSVTLRRGRLVVETVAKARAAGSYGDVIEVMNEASRKNYYVRVTGPGTTEVTDMPTHRLAALPERSSR